MKTLSNLLVLLCIAVGGSATTFATPSKESKLDELGWAFEYDDADRVTKITDPAVTRHGAALTRPTVFMRRGGELSS